MKLDADCKVTLKTSYSCLAEDAAGDRERLVVQRTVYGADSGSAVTVIQVLTSPSISRLALLEVRYKDSVIGENDGMNE